MAIIQVDVSRVRTPRLRSLGASEEPAVDEEPPDPGSFEDRVTSRRVNLMKLVREGVPEVEYLPASEGMLVRGKRHLIAAPAKTGKSLGMEVHWVDMVLAGGRVTILDRENGSEVYARRLRDIIEARNLSEKEERRVEKRLGYIQFPSIKRDDGPETADLLADQDVVVFDAQRMFLTDLKLGESGADDYAEFMRAVIDPLFRRGVATVILDNTGHKDTSRSRGASAKGDLNEVLFSMKADKDGFDLYREGTLTLKVESSRFGNRGEWTMQIGSGVYGSWTRDVRRDRPDFLAAVRAALAEKTPQGADKLVEACRRGEGAVHIGTSEARALLRTYTEQGLLRHTLNGYEVVA